MYKYTTTTIELGMYTKTKYDPNPNRHIVRENEMLHFYSTKFTYALVLRDNHDESHRVLTIELLHVYMRPDISLRILIWHASLYILLTYDDGP
jgi:hypothetical protein